MSASPHFATIPAALRTLPQWVCWRYEERNGKRTKPPISPHSNGKLLPAKTNDPATWSDFDTALATAERLKLNGVGLALAASDGLTGLDLDHVFDRETGELDPLAVEVLERFAGTYIEVSPSGDGLRIWCYGKPARSGKCEGPNKWLEVYSHPSNRYLTVTGHRYGAATAVTEQQAALDWLHSRFMTKGSTEGRRGASPSVEIDLNDIELLNKARAARNGAAFDALWAGDLSAHGGDASSADLALCNLLAFWTNSDAARMDRLFRQSGLMRPKWDTVHDPASGRTYGQMTIDKAVAGCREGYSGRKPAGAGSAPAGDQAETEERENPYRGTDDANADLLLGLHGADIRFCPSWDKWLLWTGSYWNIDERLDIEKRAADVPKMIRAQAASFTQRRSALLLRMAEMQNQFPLPDEYSVLRAKQQELEKKAEYLLKLAGKLENAAKRASMLTATRHKVVVHHSELDRSPFLLNTRNGTVDLSTGQARAHSRADLLNHLTDIPYNPSAQCPTWLQFLNDVFGGDAELIQFVQRAIGYSLTGDVREQVLLICHGNGSNGKSVFLNLLRKLLGSLALQAAPDLLMSDKQRRHPTEQADLFGKRLVVCQETEENRRFNETLVKQLTGGDGIRARRMHEDFWEFAPTHKIWLSTNHKPEIRGTDHAIWRRIRLIPFNTKFHDPGEGYPVKDTGMEAKLTAELPGILAWAVQGCLDWQRHGLGMAAAVRAATDGYQAEMDVMAAWIGECCVVGRHCEARAADLYRAYCEWCERCGEYPEKQRKFGMRLKERGFIGFTRNGAWWRGIGLASSRQDSTEGTEPTEPYSAVFEKLKTEPFSYRKTAENGSIPSVPSVASQSATLSPSVDIPQRSEAEAGRTPCNRVNTSSNSGDSSITLGERKGEHPATDRVNTLEGDAQTLWNTTLRYYLGAETEQRLARKVGWDPTRVRIAAQALKARGMATVNGDLIKPVHKGGQS